MKPILLALSLTLLLVAGFAAHASQADSEAAQLYVRCKGCHGADGSKPQDGHVIQGMSVEKLEPKSSGGGPLKPSSAETGRRLTPKMVRMGTA